MSPRGLPAKGSPKPARRRKPEPELSTTEQIKGALAAFGQAAGLGPLARHIVDAEQAMIDRLVGMAKRGGIPDAKIQQALAFRARAERAMFLIALLYPVIPNAELIRAVAGKPTLPPSQEKPASKKKRR